MKAWHFLPTDRRLRYGGDTLVEAGHTYTTDQLPVLCESGLHASTEPLDALGYAPGPIICRVDIGGEIVDGGDKIVGTERIVIWMGDATDCLRHFARLCALDVTYLWDAPDVVLRYLHTGDESIRAAARDAAWDATWDATWDAARAAARDAARAAARAAAWDAARDAAWDAARAAQNRRLARMLTQEVAR